TSARGVGMGLLRKTLLLLIVAALPAAALSYLAGLSRTDTSIEAAELAASPPCFTAGPVTYQIAPPGVASPDFRVKIGDADPELRVTLVDRVDSADVALVDELDVVGACMSAGGVRTVRVVGEASAADLTVSLSREGGDADLKLFVHSARFSDDEAAALLAAMRLDQRASKLAHFR